MSTSRNQPFYLLINPPIYDFAAYDLWAKPLGLLSIAAILRKAGAQVRLIDFMDRLHPAFDYPVSTVYGCGKYYAQDVARPCELAGIPRRYKRYGLPEEIVIRELLALPCPEAVLVTSGMTYWYPGVQEAVRIVRGIFPKVPVILGGTYATLCPEHARGSSGADYVLPGSDPWPLMEMLKKFGLPVAEAPASFAVSPAPEYALYSRLAYAALRTTWGCPCRCSYCAIETLAPGPFRHKDPLVIAEEIYALWLRGIRNFAFYDDALFHQSEEHIIPLLEAVRGRGVQAFFHSPNGLHARSITPRLATLLRHAGFVLPRLSLEYTDPEWQKKSGGKVGNEDFLCAVRILREAGYREGEYAAYTMIGLPGQDLAQAERTVRFAHEAGALVFTTEYSPIPGTRDWQDVRVKLPSEDPFWHNNSIFPLYPLTSWHKLHQVKILARQLNKCFT